MTKRKSPIKHRVRSYKRQEKIVHNYIRGHGFNLSKIANPMIKTPKLKHFVVFYTSTTHNGHTTRDSTNVFVQNEKDIISNLQSNFCGTPPEIKILRIELQEASQKRLKPLLDVDTRTRNRMNRGYILDNVPISLINLPPIRSSGRLEDNKQKMKSTKSCPPVHLSPTPDGRYDIEDGVHRIHSAVDLGYKSIPALWHGGT